MLPFHPLTIADKSWIDRIALDESSRSADFVFGNMFLWDEKYTQQVCRHGSRLLVMAGSGENTIFPFPIGSGDLVPAIEALARQAEAMGIAFMLRGVEDHHRAMLEDAFPGRFIFCHDSDYDDYVYFAEKLASLSGKKMHGKRNHCKRFEAAYNWSFRPLTREMFPLCIELLAQWGAENENGTELVAAEKAAIFRAFEHFDTLGLMGGGLFVEDTLAAFTIGEQNAPDCFNIHFEKARADIDGAYPMINREFARHILERIPEIKYINREDDMGLENIRKAKRSYRPDMMIEKYSARWMNI